MFTLTPEQVQRIEAWKDEHNRGKYSGAIGGRYTYSFTPTSLGVIVKVRDNLINEELDVTEYDEW